MKISRFSTPSALLCILIASICIARADPLDTWMPIRKHLTQVIFGNGRFVAVGNSGAIITSVDGLNWTVSESNTEKNLLAVAYGDQEFLAVGIADGLADNCGSMGVPCYNVLTSKDGLAWAPVPIALPMAFLSLAYGNGQFIAGFPVGVGQSEDGIHWTQRFPSTSEIPLLGGTYGGGQFVFVGDRGRIVSSTNGVSWVERASGTTTDFAGVAFGNGQYVAVGTGGIYTSADGIDWAQTDEIEFSPLRGVTYGNGRFIAVGDGGLILSSLNGTTWTQRDAPSDDSFTSVAYGNGVFVAVGGYGEIATSTDGDSWSVLFPRVSFPPVRDVAYGNGQFMSVGYEIFTFAGGIFTSEDGLYWRQRLAGPGFGGVAVAFGNGRFAVAGAGYNEGGVVSASFDTVDGVGWDQSWIGASAIVFGDRQFLAAAGNTIFISTDGKAWASYPSGVTNGITAVAYGKGRYVAVGENTTFLTSTDGQHWTPGNSTAASLPYAFTGICFGNDRFVAVDRYGKTASSADGINWTLNSWPHDPPDTLNSVAFGGGYFVAVGRRGVSGAVLTSTDGTVWARRSSPIDDELVRIVFGNGYFLAIGSQGATVRSSNLALPLVIRRDPATATIEISAAGISSGTFILETSADCVSWQPTANILFPPNSGTQVLRLPITSERAFFRARMQ